MRRGWWECGCDGGLWGQGPWRAHGLMAHVTRTYLSNGARGKMGKGAMAGMTGGETESAVVTIVTGGGVEVRGQCGGCGGRVANTALQHVVGDDVECANHPRQCVCVKATPKSSKHSRDSKICQSKTKAGQCNHFICTKDTLIQLRGGWVRVCVCVGGGFGRT